MKKTPFLAAALLATALSSPLRAAKPEIWFCPLDDMNRVGPGYSPVVQFMDLFKTDSPWKEAASHVSVFKIYQTWAQDAPESELKTAFADLKRRGIPIALEVDVLTPRSNADVNVGGFGRMSLLKFAKRIKDNGGDLKYIAMDEPIGLCMRQGNTPALMSLQEVVDNTVKNIKEMQAVYPDIQVGDIEPIGMAELAPEVAAYREGWKAFARAGVPLAFFHADQDWYKPGVLSYLSALKDAAHQEGLSFGIIFDGDPQDGSDAAWLKNAEKEIIKTEATIGTPDAVIIQTWHPWPKKLLPEQDGDAFTHLINVYFRTRTAVTLTADGTTVTGKLLTDKGEPVAGATVQVSEEASSKEGAMITETGTGVIPVGTTSAVFAVWDNESGWPGTENLRVKQFKVETPDGWFVTKTFETGIAGWGGIGDGAGGRVFPQDSMLVVNPTPGRQLQYNSLSFPVDKIGKPFTFTVQAQIPPAATDTGCFGVFFLNKTGELWRTLIPFRAALTPVGTAVTKADGSWSFTLPGTKKDVSIKASYAGDSKYWPAQASN